MKKENFLSDKIYVTQPLTKAEAKLLMSDEVKDLRARCYFTLQLYTGRRVSELLQLKWQHVVGKDGEIREKIKVWSSKQKKGFVIVLNKQCRFILAKYLQQQKQRWKYVDVVEYNAYVFCYKKTSPLKVINRDTVNTFIKIWMEKLGIETEKMSSHSLRKTRAYHHFVEHGIESTCAFLGHSCTAMTLKYLGMDSQKSIQEQVDFEY